jgi:hypothetical protein
MAIMDDELFIIFSSNHSNIAVYSANQARLKMETAYARRRAKINLCVGPKKLMTTDGALSVKRAIRLAGLSALTTLSDIKVFSIRF